MIHSRYRTGLWHPYEKPMYGVLLNPYHPLSRGLIGCWLFNEGGGNIVYDLSGYGNHGTLGGGTAGYCPAWTAGKSGSVLSFDGNDDYIEMPNTDTLLKNKTEGTILIWVRNPGQSSNHRGIAGWRSTHNFYILHLKNSDDLEMRIRTEDGVWDLKPSFAGYYDTLTQIVFTRNDNVAKVYFNADEVASRSDISGAWLWPGNFRVAHSNYPYFDGKIEFVFFWERGLSSEEIVQSYTDPFCMFCHPLEAELLYAAPPAYGIVPQAMHHYRMLREV